jgi:hypothetical protein
MPSGWNPRKGNRESNHVRTAGKALLVFGTFLAMISVVVTAFGGGLDPTTDPDVFIENTETSTQIL